MTGDTLKLVALVLPLGLDTFGVALALGIAGLPPDKRLRVALVFAAFEATMPLAGVAVGAPLGQRSAALPTTSRERYSSGSVFTCW